LFSANFSILGYFCDIPVSSLHTSKDYENVFKDWIRRLKLCFSVGEIGTKQEKKSVKHIKNKTYMLGCIYK
jgi:hypothetical protein